MTSRLCCLVLTLSVQILPAVAEDLPKMQEGLWEIRIHTVQKPTNVETDSTVKICRDRSYDKTIEDLAKYRTGCSNVATEAPASAADTVKIARTCKVSGSIVETNATVTVQSDSAHAEVRTSY